MRPPPPSQRSRMNELYLVWFLFSMTEWMERCENNWVRPKCLLTSHNEGTLWTLNCIRFWIKAKWKCFDYCLTPWTVAHFLLSPFIFRSLLLCVLIFFSFFWHDFEFFFMVATKTIDDIGNNKLFHLFASPEPQTHTHLHSTW